MQRPAYVVHGVRLGVITLVILRITRESWQTISKTEPGEMLDHTD